jgi:hypothetical protein
MKLFIHSSSILRSFACVAGVAFMLVACGGGDAGGDGPAPPAWQIAQLLEATAGEVDDIDVAINASGVGYAVWTQADLTDGRTKVMSSRYINGAWESVQEVSKSVFANDVAKDPKVVVHPDGRATAIWMQRVFTGQAVVGSTVDANGSWPDQLKTLLGSMTSAPVNLGLSSDGLGNAIAVWALDGTVHASYFSGNDFRAVQQISVGAGSGVSSPAVVMDTSGSGDALAIWIENDTNKQKVFSRSFVDGTWSATAIALSSNTPDGIDVAKVTMGSNGKAVAVWGQRQGASHSLMARVAINAPGGQWGAEELLASGETFSLNASMDPQGRAVVVWEQAAGVRFNILASRFDGLDWAAPVKIESDDAGDAFDVRIGMDASGHAFAVWEQDDGTRSNVMANRMDATTGAWGTPERIETEDRGVASEPSLAVNASGSAVAAWTQQDGTTDAGGDQIGSVAANVFK